LTVFVRRTRRRITAVAKKVNINVRNALFFGGLEEGEEMVDMRMDTAV
jgi:hypothetical protein